MIMRNDHHAPVPVGLRHAEGCDTCTVGVRAVLEVRGRAVRVADPSGGSCDAAGDFDRLLPVTEATCPILSRIDPCAEVRIAHADLPAVASEVAILLGWAAHDPERRGLLRLAALAVAGRADPEAELRFIGD
jgi:hypothetical protein